MAAIKPVVRWPSGSAAIRYKDMCKRCGMARYLEPSGLCDECDDDDWLRKAVAEWAAAREEMAVAGPDTGGQAYRATRSRYIAAQEELAHLAREMGLGEVAD